MTDLTKLSIEILLVNLDESYSDYYSNYGATKFFKEELSKNIQDIHNEILRRFNDRPNQA